MFYGFLLLLLNIKTITFILAQEKAKCYFNDDGKFIEPCEIRFHTDELIEEKTIRGESLK